MILTLTFFTFIVGLIFMLIGISIGGNFFTNFELFGARGYEATGNLGFYIGILIGLVLSYFIYKYLNKKINRH